MHENIEFLQAFLKNPLKVGAIAPSSPELSRKMLEDVNPRVESIVLELGPGTGSFTKLIGDLLPEKGCYLGVELDRNLVKCLRLKFPDIRIVRGNAYKAFAIHQRSELGKVDYILSGLPFASMPGPVSIKIYEEIARFMDLGGCMFRTFQYAHGYYLPSAIKLREFMKKRYGAAEKSPLVIKNVPPAYTLTWRS
ncbi:MAG: rRNA adenine N-6-methyltransferase family protein [Pyrinomonadaceae bacterium]